MAGQDYKRLPQAEFEIMLIVWDAHGPVSSTYILEKFKEQRQWALPTLMTVLTRLVNKGFLECTKVGRNNRYDAVIDGEDYKKFYIDLVMDRVFKGSFEALTDALYENGSISKNDIKNVAKKYK